MDFDEWRLAWFKAFSDQGHTPELDGYGDIDQFVCSGGFHNGPGCSTCGWSTCMHCTDMKKIPKCASSPPEHSAAQPTP